MTAVKHSYLFSRVTSPSDIGSISENECIWNGRCRFPSVVKNDSMSLYYGSVQKMDSDSLNGEFVPALTYGVLNAFHKAGEWRTVGAYQQVGMRRTLCGYLVCEDRSRQETCIKSMFVHPMLNWFDLSQQMLVELMSWEWCRPTITILISASSSEHAAAGGMKYESLGFSMVEMVVWGFNDHVAKMQLRKQRNG